MVENAREQKVEVIQVQAAVRTCPV